MASKAAQQRIEVSVIVRPRHPLVELEARLNAGQAPLTREEYAASYGADPADLAAVETFARQHGLEVVEISPERRTVRLAGSVAEISSAFGVQLVEQHTLDGTSFRAPREPPRLPAELEGIVQGVFGLDTRPVASPH